MTTAAVPRGNGEEGGPDGRSPQSVLGKVGLILSAFGDGGLSLSLTELTARTGVAKATAHRLCQDLVTCELLERDGSHYRLGLPLYAIGPRAPRQRTLRHATRPVLARPAPRMRRMTARTLTAVRLPEELLRIQEQDCATDFEEHRLGYSAVAVPVRGPHDGAYLGALSVVASTAHNLRRTLTALRTAAEAVTTRLAVIETYRTEP